MLTKKQRHILLYFVTGTLLLNIVVSLVRGTSPPNELYVLLSTIAGYLLLGETPKKHQEIEPANDDDDPAPDDKAAK